MAKRYEYTYEVASNHRFPLDMLRYDRCWPATEAETTKLQNAINQSGRTGEAILLRGLKPPTVGRWVSFGWHVVGEPDKQPAAL